MGKILFALVLLFVLAWNVLEGLAGAGPASKDPLLKKALFVVGSIAYLALGFYMIMLPSPAHVTSVWTPLLTIFSFSIWALVGIILYIKYDAQSKK